MNQLTQKKIRLIIKVAAVFALGIVATYGIYMALDSNDELQFLAYIIPALLVVGLLYAILVRHYRGEDEAGSYYVNKYHDVFFKGTIVFSIVLVALAMVYSFVMYLNQNNLFAIMGLLIMVVWIAVFMIYFVWSVYHYNINFGITDGEWKEIAKAKKEAREFGVDLPNSGVREPTHNPYRSQTFGLPPGTVRGMIAFTLLFGGISLLISSMGNTDVDPNLLQLRIQQFEFFETAFLMMIAFYFGDRSLKYFRERWRNPNAGTGTTAPGASPEGEMRATEQPGTGPRPSSQPEVMDELMEEDAEFEEEDKAFGLESSKPTAVPSGSPATELKNALMLSRGEEVPTTNLFPFVQIQDNINRKILNDDQIQEELENLANGPKKILLKMPVVKAVISVESSGRGHLSDGRAKILFEGHLFWKHVYNDIYSKLPKEGKTEDQLKAEAKEKIEVLSKSNPDILYKFWTRDYYKGGFGEYDRLNKAKAINEKAAVYSASWGLFQILGENLDHNIKSRNYADYKDFEKKQHENELYHFLDFLAFIMTKSHKGKKLYEYIQGEDESAYNWAAFAFGYNGQGYKANKYDIKLAESYAKFKKIYS